jgi:hypothetical protein
MEEGRLSRSPLSAGPLEVEPAASSQRSSALSLCTQGFWKNHPEAWPNGIEIGGVLYTQEQALEILSTPPKGGDATYILAHQLIAAMLNELSGADTSVLGTTIADADAWLVLHPLGSNPRGPEREEGIALATVLDEFNNGLLGGGDCPEPTPSPTPTPDDTGDVG